MSVAPSADYFAALSSTDLMRVVIALSTEVYALTDRLRALESALSRHGVDLRALDAPMSPAAFDAARRAERDAFVQRVFAALEQPDTRAPKAGAPRAASSPQAARPIEARRKRPGKNQGKKLVAAKPVRSKTSARARSRR